MIIIPRQLKPQLCNNSAISNKTINRLKVHLGEDGWEEEDESDVSADSHEYDTDEDAIHDMDDEDTDSD